MPQIKAEQVVLASASRSSPGGNSEGFLIATAKELFLRVNVTVITGNLVLFFDTCGNDGAWKQFATSGTLTGTGNRDYTFNSRELGRYFRLRWTIGTSFTATADLFIVEQL